MNYKELMAGKSDEDLQKYMDERKKYTPEAVDYAIAEMQKRGRVFSDEELTNIRQENQLKKVTEGIERKGMWNKNVVKDEAAPSYYSETAIYVFGIVFGVLFSSVLLAINFNKAAAKKEAIWLVIGFGITYTALQIWILSELQVNSSGTTLFSMIGTLLMRYLFWGRYIGKDTKYRATPIWKPLIIGIILCTPLLLAIIYGGI